jgi:hypothetical protein
MLRESIPGESLDNMTYLEPERPIHTESRRVALTT